MSYDQDAREYSVSTYSRSAFPLGCGIVPFVENRLTPTFGGDRLLSPEKIDCAYYRRMPAIASYRLWLVAVVPLL